MDDVEEIHADGFILGITGEALESWIDQLRFPMLKDEYAHGGACDDPFQELLGLSPLRDVMIPENSPVVRPVLADNGGRVPLEDRSVEELHFIANGFVWMGVKVQDLLVELVRVFHHTQDVTSPRSIVLAVAVGDLLRDFP